MALRMFRQFNQSHIHTYFEQQSGAIWGSLNAEQCSSYIDTVALQRSCGEIEILPCCLMLPLAIRFHLFVKVKYFMGMEKSSVQ